MRTTRLFLLLPLLAACNSTPSAVNEGSVSRMADRQGPNSTTTPAATNNALPAPDTAHTKAASAVSDTLRVARLAHNFSRPKGPADKFQLVFRGPSILEGTGEFTITDPDGQVIFREMLTEPDLEAALVYEMKGPTATRAERETFVLRRIDRFFLPKQFHTPAVAAKAAFPDGVENLDRATWNDFQNRPDAIGFEYLKGKEDSHQIAWSPLKKQTVRVR
ncbi:hypothetical protein KB206_07385 [Microvirga sp. STS02]|uniref:hypothetical protein n=1 Tax=Hymenobacter negativus TaxID=2795026 RepID=UPI0018DEBF4E|nr:MULTISPECIES: hypothetical protein [Bacteria]MBH8568697.1 hypothetical protein [Hymenobacter negativus]MBR7208431.1 hypothetical protein [Microvirga sp. STS02]